MDPKQFDLLSRRLSAAGTRRRALTAIVAAALAPLAATAKPEPAACLPAGRRCSRPAAAAVHGNGKRTARGKHRPPACDKCCSRFGSTGLDGKPRCTCKGEGIACDNPSQCCSGQCRDGGCTACPANTVFCPDGCANLQTDNNHCGSCENACDPGQRCQDGTCVCDAQSCPTGCCGGADGTACQRGTSAQACGVGGAGCQQCIAPEGGGAVCQSDGTCAQT
ncbi:MAG TPA: hypothetical protein VFU81_06650, partial [Thermomicrobiales bacterium]|nr:hypothetical protein [Thermomicrobiales bacterium]